MVDRVLLRVSVEISDTRKDDILVYEKDLQDTHGPERLAKEFCERHELDPEKVLGPLQEHIQTNLLALTPSKRQQLTDLDKKNEEIHPVQEPILEEPHAPPVLEEETPHGDDVTTHENSMAESKKRAVRVPRQASGNSEQSASTGYLSARMQGVRPQSVGPNRGGPSPRRILAVGSPKRERPATARVRGESNEPEDKLKNRLHNVFHKLYGDAMIKTEKWEKIRKEHGRDADKRASSHGRKEGSIRRVNTEEPGHRLYCDAERKLKKFELLREKQREINMKKEQEELTLTPSINESQRVVYGSTSRYSLVQKQVAGEKKIEEIRRELRAREMDGCTFHPQIDNNSLKMMENRLNRLRITGTLHDHLYDDAKRRAERYNSDTKKEKDDAGYPFHPNIRSDWNRNHKNTNNIQKRTLSARNKLLYDDHHDNYLTSQIHKNDRYGNQSQQNIKNDKNKQYPIHLDDLQNNKFQPNIGKGPMGLRNENKLPIGSYLHNKGTEARPSHDNQKADEDIRDVSPKSSKGSNLSQISLDKLTEAKKRGFENIFHSLVAAGNKNNMHDDDNQFLTAQCVTSEALDTLDNSELIEFLGPIARFIIENDSCFCMENFSVAMEYAISASTKPVTHLFCKREPTKTVVQHQETTFKPQITKKSQELAHKRRDRSIPLYEQLCNERENYQQQRLKRVQARKEEMMEGCTFYPSTNNSMGASKSDPMLRSSRRHYNMEQRVLTDETNTNKEQADNRISAETKAKINASRLAHSGLQAHITIAENSVKKCHAEVLRARTTVHAHFT